MKYSLTVVADPSLGSFIPLIPGDTVKLKKEPNNCTDSEAIEVILTKESETTIGYVCNSVKAKANGTYSSGRIYDKIGSEALGTVLYVFENRAIVEVLTLE